jgi:hypothetical protein
LLPVGWARRLTTLGLPRNRDVPFPSIRLKQALVAGGGVAAEVDETGFNAAVL